MDRASELVPLRYVAIGGRGPEDVVADSRGRVLTGVEDGRILRIDGLSEPATPRVEVLAETGGRPLGLELLPDGALLVCDAELGLLRVDLGEGVVRILADSVAGERLTFCSNAVALSDGSVCFTVSSRRYPLNQWIGDLVEHTGTGRLLRLAPGSENPEVLLEGLQFANGLAPSADESFLVVAETGACRLTRYWLTGAKAGRSEPFAENLPGMPDNLWRAPGGPIWVSLAGPRVAPLDLLHRAAPAVRGAAARIAVRAPFRPTGTIGALAFDDQGGIVHHLARRRSGYRMVTSVCEAAGHLVLGSLWERGVAVCERPVPK
ncbi:MULTISPECIES: SMP-30/gluconolactonase/LRE family protein [unclassified Streptomyces]|uniref:SMP-30/gluconolactonase/LRE family protein n=1 Tax=unclassified Streptomyces TaxID=2593676 RepID=UPI002253BDD4|nr:MULTISPECIES: SMP-30/gluconolactonase/LRE family protein [unclassified Streptomyces]MCX4878721.1 SMP-30/gluconolactonase/LRE family protein [Streptomyces sp. NBC_00847]MCX5418683.1 SMP-30/gluconolactonase/LRE family protein [Streptomyces sp. NBC_00078]